MVTPIYDAAFQNLVAADILDACSLGSFMHANGAKFYGIALFAFDDLPPDWLTAAQWMTNQWKDNAPTDRAIYPAWAGL